MHEIIAFLVDDARKFWFMLIPPGVTMTEPKSVTSQVCKHCHGSGLECWCPECQGVAAQMCRNPDRYYPHNREYFARLTHPCSACKGTGIKPVEQ